jgi:hypothetical protein
MAWRSLASYAHDLGTRADLRRIRNRAAAIGLTREREVAVLATVEAWGEGFVREHPEVANVGALALAFGDALCVHELRAPVPATVANTDLHSLPDAPPELLRAPVIVEVRQPGHELLFGDTASLGSYELEGVRYLVGLLYPDGVRVARWMPQWPGGELEADVQREQAHGLLECEPGEHHAWAIDAARFLVVLGLLLEAADSPTRVVDDAPRHARTRHGKREPARAWTVRRVYLEARAAEGDREAPSGVAGGPRSDSVAAQVQVRGHLKRQPYGPQGTLRRWQYVSAYEARRWVAPSAKVAGRYTSLIRADPTTNTSLTS